MDLCLDTQILVSASQDHDGIHCQFLAEFKECRKLKVALDRFVQQEYNEQMRADRLGQYWLKSMAANDRTVTREKVKLSKPVVRELLDKLHFSPDDLKFVELSLATEAKRLVAEDDDYSARVRKLLKKKLDLIVETCDASRHFVTANQ